jgi:hypothetical protein
MHPIPGPNEDAQQAWQRIFANPHHDGQTWACLTVAIAHADDVIEHATARILDRDRRPRRGDPLWAHIAVSGYTMLTSTGAYRHRSVDLPGRFTVDETAIRTWLRAPAPGLPTPDQTVAEQLRLDETFLLDDGQRHARIAGLLDNAQKAGVLRCPNARLELWHVADADGDLVGHRLGVLRDNHTLASDLFDIDDIVDETEPGLAAAIAAMKQVAERATNVLAAAFGEPIHPPMVVDGPDQAHTPDVPRWARGFGAGGRSLGAVSETPAPPPGLAAPAAPRGPVR